MHRAWSRVAAFASCGLNLSPATEALTRHSMERIRLEQWRHVGVSHFLDKHWLGDFNSRFGDR